MENIKICLECKIDKKRDGLYRMIEGIVTTYERKRRCHQIKVKVNEKTASDKMSLYVECGEDHKGNIIKEIHTVLFAMVTIVPHDEFDIYYRF